MEQALFDQNKYKNGKFVSPMLKSQPSAMTTMTVNEALRLHGQSLDDNTRTSLESRFGHDFSQVRIHTGARAAESAATLNAQAYTMGRDIVFGANQYAPETAAGQRLLTHELTHVVQQSGAGPLSQPLALDYPDDHLEHQASRVSQGGILNSLSRPSSPLIQRQLLSGQASSGLPGLHLPVETLELDRSVSISVDSPQVQQLAASYNSLAPGNPQAYIRLSSYLSDGAKMSLQKADEERDQAQERMAQLRNALVTLGVPRSKIEIRPATIFWNIQAGKITAEVFKELPRLIASPLGVTPSLLAPPATAQPGAGPTQSLSDRLTVTFGPLKVELPKSLTLTLPIPINSTNSIEIELKGELLANFAFSIAYNGIPHVRVAAKAGIQYDPTQELTSGSVGLEIQTTTKACFADNPELLRMKIKDAGAKLNKAMAEAQAETDNEEKIKKYLSVASALGEIVAAADKLTTGCKQVPVATFNIGLQGPLGTPTSTETDPLKRPATYFGISATFRF